MWLDYVRPSSQHDTRTSVPLRMSWEWCWNITDFYSRVISKVFPASNSSVVKILYINNCILTRNIHIASAMLMMLMTFMVPASYCEPCLIPKLLYHILPVSLFQLSAQEFEGLSSEIYADVCVGVWMCVCACMRVCMRGLQWSSPLSNMSHVSCSLHSVVSLKENVW